MKAIIKVNTGITFTGEIINEEFEMDMSREGDKIILKSNNLKGIWEILETGEFTVTMQPTQDEVGCGTYCSTCLTPIC